MRKVSHYSWDDSEDFVYCFISADRIAWVTVSYLAAPSPYFFFFFYLLLALQVLGILGGIFQLLFCSRG